MNTLLECLYRQQAEEDYIIDNMSNEDLCNLADLALKHPEELDNCHIYSIIQKVQRERLRRAGDDLVVVETKSCVLDGTSLTRWSTNTLDGFKWVAERSKDIYSPHQFKDYVFIDGPYGVTYRYTTVKASALH